MTFWQLFAAKFPIRQLGLVDDFGGDDERSTLADNTSAFNCRRDDRNPGTHYARSAEGSSVIPLAAADREPARDRPGTGQ